MNMNKTYESPVVKVVNVVVEKGFAGSGNATVQSWGNGGSYNSEIFIDF